MMASAANCESAPRCCSNKRRSRRSKGEGPNLWRRSQARRRHILFRFLVMVGVFGPLKIPDSARASSSSSSSSFLSGMSGIYAPPCLLWGDDLPGGLRRPSLLALSQVRARIMRDHLLQEEEEYAAVESDTCQKEETWENPWWFSLADLRLAAVGCFLFGVFRKQAPLLRMSLMVGFLLAAYGKDCWTCIADALRSFGAAYMMYLDTYPVATKSATAGVIAMIGDYFAQWVEFALEESEQTQRNAASTAKRRPGALSIYGRYHLRRGLSLLADGIFISGPLMHAGYELFESILPIAGGTNAGLGSTVAAMVHVLADSVVLDSFFVAFTFVSTGLMEGMHHRSLFLQFKTDYVPSLTASWATSVALCPIQFCFFRYLPLNLRVLSVNCIDLVWGAVQSFMSHRNRPH